MTIAASSIGLGIAILGGMVAVVGILAMLRRIRDTSPGVAGLRLVYAGAAMMCLGGGIYIFAIPSDTLPFPLGIAFGLFWLLLSLRLARAMANPDRLRRN